MPLPTAPLGGPVATLPQRAAAARYLLFAMAPLTALTFVAYLQVAGGTGVRAGLVVAAVVCPLVLVAVGRRVGRDHQPAQVPGATPPGRAGRWDWTDVVAFLPAAAGGALLTGSLLVGLTDGLDHGLAEPARTALESFANQAAQYAAALGALVVLLILRRGLRPRDLGWRVPRRLGAVRWVAWVLIGAAAAVVALVVTTWLGNVAVQLLPNSPNTQCITVRGQYGGYLALAVPLVCVVAPLAEETIFRGFIYGWLRRHLPVIPAALLSAAVFSAAHVVLVLALPLFAVGIILALLYEYSDSLVPGAIAHGLFNLVGIIAILGTTSTC